MIIKTVITQFFNTAVIYYIISLVMPSPLLSDKGIVLQVTSLIVISGFIQIITNIIYVPDIIKKVMNRLNYG
jgi:hypothetical protein